MPILEETRAEKCSFSAYASADIYIPFQDRAGWRSIYYAFILLQAFPVTYLSVTERSRSNVRQVLQLGRVNYFRRDVIRFSQVMLMNIQVFSDVTPCRLVKEFKEKRLSGKCLILKRKVRFSETSVNIYQSTCRNTIKGPE